MRIYTENAEEYITVKLSLCGEIDQEKILDEDVFAKGSVYRAIKELRERRVVKKHKYDDGRTFLRMSSLGVAAIESLAPALLSNARNLVNAELKYSGAKDARLKERANYEFYANCLEKGIQINGINIEYRPRKLFEAKKGAEVVGESIFTDDGPPRPLEKIAEEIGPEYTGLLTKKVIKERHEKKGSRSSRITATLVLNGRVYQAYVLGDPEKSAWIAEAEINAANYISGTIERHSEQFKDQGVRLSNVCLLLYPGKEEAEKMIYTASGREYRIDPCRIYGESYVIPAYDLSETKIMLLSTPAWTEKMTSLLFPDAARSEIADGIEKDGTEIHNFIGCEIGKIRAAARRLKLAPKETIIVVEPWMSDAISKVFDGTRAQIVEIKDEDLKVIAKNIT